jgi:hypothetical protein
VGPPLVQVGRDGLDHLAVQVEAEVVAGGEVDQPALADPDPAAVDLLDDRVQQWWANKSSWSAQAANQIGKGSPKLGLNPLGRESDSRTREFLTRIWDKR